MVYITIWNGTIIEKMNRLLIILLTFERSRSRYHAVMDVKNTIAATLRTVMNTERPNEPIMPALCMPVR